MAQEFIGLDAEKMSADKKRFLEVVIPEWQKIAEERGRILTEEIANLFYPGIFYRISLSI